MEQYGGVVTSRLEIINGVAAMLSPDAARKLASEAGLWVTPNSKMSVENLPVAIQGKDDKSTPATDYPDVVGADTVWAAGVTGQGVTVALLDTGMAKLSGLEKSSASKGKRILAWSDFVDNKGKAKGNLIDPNGHGTHVAGVIANSDRGSDDEWNGVAPGVSLVIGRVADDQGYATYETLLQGIQWVVSTRDQYKTRVLNISMSAEVRSPYWADPVNRALMVAWKEGIVVVTAAGNNGPKALSIGVPGNNPYLITVGAFTDAYTPFDWSDDYIPSFSSAGPTHDGFIKPDLIAPGGHIISLISKDSYLAQTYPENIAGKNYFKLAGTSQSAAVVSGIVALMLEQNPRLTPDMVKFRLRATAIPQFNPDTKEAGYSVWQQGAGRAFAPLAVFANLRGVPDAVEDGYRCGYCQPETLPGLFLPGCSGYLSSIRR